MKKIKLLIILAILVIPSFMFPQGIQVTSPNGGEILKIGNTYSINWNLIDATINNVKIDISEDNGATWRNIAASVTASTETYSFNISSPTYNASVNNLIRVSDAINSADFDISNNVFTIYNLDIIQPIALDAFNAGDNITIQWSASNDINNLNVYYSLDGGLNWNLLNTVAASQGFYTWSTASNQTTSNALIKIEDQADPTNKNHTSGQFRIGSLIVTAPNGGESYFSGDIIPITWNSQSITNVDIDYSNDAGATWQRIVSGYSAASGNYQWTFGNNVSEQSLIRISDTDQPTITDNSDNTFIIHSLVLTNPSSTIGWDIGSTTSIGWTTNLTGNISIQLSTDGGATFSTLTSAVSAPLGTYSFVVPNTPSNNVVLKLINNLNLNQTIQSTSNITIGQVALTNPVGGETWFVGDNQNITWTASTSVNTIKIDYSPDNINWTTIIDNYNSSAGSYIWAIPNNFSSPVISLRISDAQAGTGISDISTPITVTNLNLTSPIGSEAWEAGTTQNITWQSNLSVSSLKIEYSSNNGSSWNQIATGIDASLNSYSWTIPANLNSTQMLIKLTSESDANVNSQSFSAFKIGDIFLTLPNGGEALFGGKNYSIQWSATSSISSIDLEYSSDGGNSFTTIATQINASDGQYSWTVPNSYTSQGRVRIFDSFGNSIDDTSNSDFTVAYIQVLSPNGGEGYQPGNNVNIQWLSQSVNTISLDYSLDGGTNWSQIAVNLNAIDGQYNWTVPNVAGSNVLIRARSTANGNLSDESDAPFKIASISVLNPNGGEIIQTGSNQTVQWSSGTEVSSVDLDYSVDGGTSWISIQNGIQNASSFNWSVNNTPSANALIRASDSNFPNIYDVSDTVFTIERLILTSPNGGEVFLVDSVATLTWDSQNINNVKLEYSEDAGITWSSIVNSTIATTQSYNWTIPNVPSTQMLIRISDADNPGSQITDISDATFEINLLNLLNPDGGEVFEVGSLQSITWNANSSVLNIDLFYSINNGTSWNTIATNVLASGGSYQWTVPNVITTEGLVRIVNTSNTNIVDASTNTFSIGTISLTSPIGGEKWQVATTHQITWNNIASVTSINIDFSIDGGINWSSIATRVDATLGIYDWVIPNSVSSLAKIRISNSDDLAIYDQSSNNFTIANLIVSSPNGGESYSTGENVQIAWQSLNVSSVNLDYSIDNGASWNQIISNYTGGQNYTWTIPSSSSTAALVRVSDSQDQTIFDISDNNFSIISLTLTSPNGNEGWLLNDQKAITWTSSGISTISLDYSSDNGSTWNTIASNVSANLSTYNWQLPNLPGKQFLVRITDDATGAFDLSDNNFVIGSISITNPIVSTFFKSGEIAQITWSSTTGIDFVNIEYRTGPTQAWTTIVNDTRADLGSYQWNVPNSVQTSTAEIRLSHNAVGTEILDVSPIFQIHSLQLITPNGGEFLTSGNNYNITWNTSLTGNVILNYSLDNGNSWSLIQNNLVASNQSYTWTIPTTASTNQGLIKITDMSNPLFADSSSTNFKIGWITISSPTIDSVFQLGKSANIAWNNSSSVTSVNIEYDLNSSGTWTTIANNVNAANGSYNWNINSSSAVNSNVRIRVTDASSSNQIYSISDIFRITQLQIQSPLANTTWNSGATETIQWQSTNITNVDVLLSLDGGTNWSNLLTNYASNDGINVYNYSVPANYNTTNAYLKIRDNQLANINDQQGPFNISSLNLTYPVGGEKLQSGKTYTLTYTSTTNINLINAEYTLNAGSPTEQWNSIAADHLPSNVLTWTVPQGISSNTVKVRISDSPGGTIISESGILTIANLSLVSPIANTFWKNFATHSISWNYNYVDTIVVAYSTNSGSTWTEINRVSGSNGLNWQIPTNTYSNNARIKIFDSADNTISSELQADFKIAGVTVQSPNGNESFNAGSTIPISYTYSPNVSFVRLDYSIDNGANWLTINSNTSATGNYSWNVPSNIISDSCLVRVSDAESNLSIDDQSDASFIITALRVLSPNGGENYQVGQNISISWQSVPSITTLVLEYSIDNTNWQLISNNVNSSLGSFSWTIPNLAADSVNIRVSDQTNASLFDVTDNPFFISQLVLTSPVGNFKVQNNSSLAINWQSSNNINQVTLQYSTDGINWLNVSDVPILASLGNYSWNLDSSGVSCADSLKIKINDFTFPQIGDTTTGNVSIVDLTLVYPIGGESVEIGKTIPLQWTSCGINNIVIEKYDGVSWSIVDTVIATLGTYNWIVTGPESNLNKIRIKALSNNSFLSTGNSFTTYSPGLTLLSPNGNEHYKAGTNMLIQYSLIGITKLGFEFFDGTQWGNQRILDVVDGTGNFNFVIPTNVETQSALVRLYDANNSLIADTSNNAFTVSNLQLIVPDQRVFWESNRSDTIRWTASNFINTIDIEVYNNNTLMNSWPNVNAALGQIVWIKNFSDYSSNARFIIKDSQFPNVVDTSAQLSKIGWILGDQIVQTGAQLKSGTNLPISFTHSSNLTNFKMEILNLQNGSRSTLFPLFANNDTIWSMPQNYTIDSAALIISDYESAGLIADTTNMFSIQSLNVTTPTAGTSWRAGTTQTIRWSASLSIDSVRVEYSTDGVSWYLVDPANPVVSSTVGQINWRIPANISSTNSFVRIFNEANHSIADTSGQFSIFVSSIQLTTFNGGECLSAGSSAEIQWVQNNINSVLIFYSLDNGSNWISVNDSIPIDANLNTYTWSVPNLISSDSTLLKIQDFENFNNFNVSNSVFKIGWITLNSPIGNSTLIAGSNINIDFNVAASISQVQIFYSTDDIPTLLPIGNMNVTSGNNNFVWSSLLSANISSQNVRVWIRDSECQNSIIASSNIFTISTLKITQPNGGEFITSNIPFDIKWNASDFIDRIKIDLVYDNNFVNVVPSIPAKDSVYVWNVPQSLITSNARIIITDLINQSISDTSDNVFSIGGLSLLSFTTSEKIQENTIYNINWTNALNITSVDFQYKLNKDANWQYCRDSAGNLLRNVDATLGTIGWLVPKSPSNDCYVKIIDANNSNSNTNNIIPFTIARFTVISPNGGEFIQLNPTLDNSNLTFQIRKDYIDNFRMELKDFNRNRIVYQSIDPTPDTIAGDYYTYSIDLSSINDKDYAGNSYKLIINDEVFDQINDSSNADFTLSYLRLVDPNGSSGQQIGTVYPITWDASLNTVDSINIYTRDKGSEFWRLANSSPLSAANDNQWLWNINIPPNPNVEMKIVDALHATDIYDYSDDTFTIEEIQLISPIGGEILQFNKNTTIKWSTTFVSSVRVEYQIDGNQWVAIPDEFGSDIISTDPNGTASYEINWSLIPPIKPSNNVHLRVVDNTYENVQSVSDSITIAELGITFPNEKTAFKVGDQYSITWSASQLNLVDIFLLRGESNDLTPIAYNVDASLGIYPDFIPKEENITNDGKIVIVSVSETNVRDTSNNSFLIGLPPVVNYDNKFQSQDILFSLDYFASGSRIRIEKAAWKLPNESQYHSPSDELSEAGQILTGAFTKQTLTWNSLNAGLQDFEGYIDIKFNFTLPDQNDALFEVPIKSVKIDNKAPEIDANSITFLDGPFQYGWNNVELNWNAPSDSSLPLEYQITFIDSTNNSPIITPDTNYVLNGLFTASNYNTEIAAIDKLGNSSKVNFAFQTRYLGDYQNNINPRVLAIDAEDLLPFVNSWVSDNPDSIKAADIYPYNGKIELSPKDFNVQVYGDGKLDVYDLITLIDAYYVSAKSRHNLPIPSKIANNEWSDSEESEIVQFKKGENEMFFPIDFDSMVKSRVLSSTFRYDPSVFDVDSLTVTNTYGLNENEIVLSYIDSVNGIAHLDMLCLDGNFKGNYNLRAQIIANYERTQMSDSLGITFLSLNKDGKHIIDNTKKYIMTQLPSEFTLRQNYPNPFNPTTIIEYELPAKAKVMLEIYNILGQRVATLINHEQNAGIFKYEFNSQKINGGLASGVYIYRISAGKFSGVKKMLLLK